MVLSFTASKIVHPLHLSQPRHLEEMGTGEGSGAEAVVRPKKAVVRPKKYEG